MFREFLYANESFRADGARMWQFVLMGPDVFQQITALRELLAADVTVVTGGRKTFRIGYSENIFGNLLFLASVLSYDVILATTPMEEFLTAKFARIAFIIFMDPRMQVQIFDPLETHSAYRASVLSLIIV